MIITPSVVPAWLESVMPREHNIPLDSIRALKSMIHSCASAVIKIHMHAKTHTHTHHRHTFLTQMLACQVGGGLQLDMHPNKSKYH